ncbi:Methionyl/Valyl/Leucyl/Isoleucyl-tRNA synthetase anticodon-binding [Trinorchestia longiramus]|nr:Methionyl/Valyl/Leucyl/Isoleucyl-tRNA synthetase anticodon-binding [Trinorchestia longiramus]
MQHFLQSEGLTSHTEPFNRLLLVGRIKAPAYVRCSDGKYLYPQDVDTSTEPPTERSTGAPVKVSMEKMSKSKHNGVEPSSVLAEHSVDVTRLAVLRGESPSSNCNWHPQKSIGPVIKWILLIWRTVGKFVEMRQKKGSVPANMAEAEESLRTERNVTVATVTKHFTNNNIHSAIRNLETFARQIRSAPLDTIHGEEYERCLASLLLMLAPMMPHVAAELWQAFSDHASLQQFQVGAVQEMPWPQTDPGFQPPFRVFVTVNDDEVYKGVLDPEAVESMKWEADELLSQLTQQQQVVMKALEGRPTLRTTLEVSKESFKAKLAAYTLTPVELRRRKKEKSQKKKLLLAEKMKEKSKS